MSPEEKPKQKIPENRPNASVPDTRLDAILTATRDRIAGLRAQARELERRAAAAPAPRPFAPALAGPHVGVIAEVKRRSPSAGAIREDLDPVAHAQAYTQGGAVAISVLTDELYFGGSLEDLARVAGAVSVPVLRKDFILDELQLYEARAAGASAVLLIVRALTAEGLRALRRAARDQGLGVLVEVHSASELDHALGVDPTAVGVNSRDLATFAVDLGSAERLVALVPGGVPVIAESGIATRADVERMAAAGADLVLVGTSVARTGDPEAAVRGLSGVRRMGRPR
jgi:indole-3-glycerol phosphate synthase